MAKVTISKNSVLLYHYAWNLKLDRLQFLAIFIDNKEEVYIAIEGAVTSNGNRFRSSLEVDLVSILF